MNKTLVIGIGGTGLTAIRELRRLIAERYETGLQDTSVASVRFLYIDTDDGDLQQQTWSVLAKDISLNDGEKVLITGDNLKPVIESPSEYPDIGPWLPPIKDYVGEPGPGAKGIRPYGRLIYEFGENKAKIHDRCLDHFNELNGKFPHVPSWRYYLICGLSGGTGSGMFLPFSFDLVKWKLFETGKTAQKFYSFLVLPPVQEMRRHNRYHANAYAALRELNYYHFQQGAIPYNNCYLLEPQNADGIIIGLNDLPLLIAQRIFLNIQGGPAASTVDSRMDNPNLGDIEAEDDPDRSHARCFSSFGLASVSYPREVVAQCLAYNLAAMVVDGWLRERSYSKDINQAVRSELASIRLSLAHVQGDADPFGSNDHPNYMLEIENLIDDKLHGLGKKQLGGNATKIRKIVETTFRGAGLREFYQQRENDAKGAVEEAIKRTRVKITTYLRSPQHGLDYAKEFLDELQKILTEFKNEVTAAAGKNAERQLEVFQSNLAETTNLVLANEQKLLYTHRNFQRDRANIGDELKLYLKVVARHHAGKYGAAFLDKLFPQVTALRVSLEMWESRTREIRQSLAGKLHTILENRHNGSRENGKVIFDSRGLEKLATAAIPDVAKAAIEGLLRERLHQEELDLMPVATLREPERFIYEAAYQWVLGDGCPVDIKRITLYDKFVGEYPQSADRREILRQARALSSIFVRFSPAEVGKKAIQSTDVSVATIPDGTGRAAPDGRPTQSVVQEDLAAIGVPLNEVLVADDPERIVFLRERQVFPLRFIDSVAELKKKYDGFARKDALHVDRAIVSRLYDLYMLTGGDRKALQGAKETFVIARAAAWLIRKLNQYTQQAEIRYEYEASERIGIQKLVIGSDWDLAFEQFVKDAVDPDGGSPALREARRLLNERAGDLRRSAATDIGIRNNLLAMLKTYLHERLEEYTAKDDDPRYERDAAVINTIQDSVARPEGVLV